MMLIHIVSSCAPVVDMRERKSCQEHIRARYTRCVYTASCLPLQLIHVYANSWRYSGIPANSKSFLHFLLFLRLLFSLSIIIKSIVKAVKRKQDYMVRKILYCLHHHHVNLTLYIRFHCAWENKERKGLLCVFFPPYFVQFNDHPSWKDK